jgi:hypothetical protein
MHNADRFYSLHRPPEYQIVLLSRKDDVLREMCLQILSSENATGGFVPRTSQSENVRMYYGLSYVSPQFLHFTTGLIAGKMMDPQVSHSKMGLTTTSQVDVSRGPLRFLTTNLSPSNHTIVFLSIYKRNILAVNMHIRHTIV